MKACVLYRHYAKDGRLLYVGISLNAMARLSEHSIESEWFPLIATVTLDHYLSVADAREAERLAIKHEMPMHNIRHRCKKLSSTFAIDGRYLTIQDIL